MSAADVSASLHVTGSRGKLVTSGEGPGVFRSGSVGNWTTGHLDPAQPAESCLGTCDTENDPFKNATFPIVTNFLPLLYFELLGRGQTITSELYCAQLDRLSSVLATKRPHLLEKGVIFHRDNARPHCSRMTLQKIRDLGWTTLGHPPYSPDLAPSDYHLFRSLQHYLAGKTFENSEEIHGAISGFFNAKTEVFYRSGIEKLPERWRAVVTSGGQHIND